MIEDASTQYGTSSRLHNTINTTITDIVDTNAWAITMLKDTILDSTHNATTYSANNSTANDLNRALRLVDSRPSEPFELAAQSVMKDKL